MSDSTSRRKWTDLAPQRTFKYYGEFAELYRFVLAYLSSRAGDYLTPDAAIRQLREHLQFIEKSRHFNDDEVGANLGIPRSTAYRFIGGSRPTYATFVTMMEALADQYGIKNTRSGQKDLPHIVASATTVEAEVKNRRVQTQEALDELLDALEGMIPVSLHTSA